MSLHAFYVPDRRPEVVAPMVERTLARADSRWVSQNDPSPRGVPSDSEKWAIRISAEWFASVGGDEAYETNGQALAEGTGRDPATGNPTADLAMEGGVNALTADGHHVVVDEARRGRHDTARLLAHACVHLDHPQRVWLYMVAGMDVSYAGLDPPGEPGLVEQALAHGAGLLPEIYPSLWQAEHHPGGVGGYLDRYLRGPGDGKLPYLVDRWQAAGRSSGVRLCLGIGDQFRRDPGNPDRRSGTDYMAFLDLVLSELHVRYAEVARAGIATWKWQASGAGATIVGPSADQWAATVAAMLDHYEDGPGREGEQYLPETDRLEHGRRRWWRRGR